MNFDKQFEGDQIGFVKLMKFCSIASKIVKVRKKMDVSKKISLIVLFLMSIMKKKKKNK